MGRVGLRHPTGVEIVGAMYRPSRVKRRSPPALWAALDRLRRQHYNVDFV